MEFTLSYIAMQHFHGANGHFHQYHLDVCQNLT